MVTHFDNLPHEINRLIGSYLDYNLRVDFYRILSDREDKFVRKLDINNHQNKINFFNIVHYTEKTENTRGTQNKTLVLIECFTYLLNMKYIDLIKRKAFREIVISKAKHYSNENCEEYEFLHNAKIKEKIIEVSKELVNYMQKIYEDMPSQNFKPLLVDII